MPKTDKYASKFVSFAERVFVALNFRHLKEKNAQINSLKIHNNVTEVLTTFKYIEEVFAFN